MNDVVTTLEMSDRNDPLYSIVEGAEYLRISDTTLRKLVNEGEIRAAKYFRHTYIRRSELDRFVERHPHPTPNKKHKQGEQ
ncbi:MAG: DNA-binding protein [Micrococcales bacterium]|nr:DNA-binding protein [Micrococcales bacterium]